MIEKDTEIVIVGSDEEFQEMREIRTKVFVEEHKIPAEKEFDGNDYRSAHVLLKVKGKAVGTMRIRFFSDFVKFERMAVLPEYRKGDAADKIMNKGFQFVAKKGYQKVYGVCKKELLGRWKKCGYEPIDGAPTVQQNNMTLVPIMRELAEDENAIRITSPAELLNAKEDTWDAILQAQQIQAVVIQQNKQMQK